MHQALVNLNLEQVKANRKSVMRITGDEQEGIFAATGKRVREFALTRVDLRWS